MAMALNRLAITARWRSLRPAQKWLLRALAFACALWTIALLRMAWQPLVADDELVYNSAVHWPESPMRVNPPVYMTAVRLSFALFGESVAAARVPGILSGFISLFLIAAIIVRALDGTDKAYLTATVAVGLYALYPQAIQNMMFIDIDAAFLTAVLLGLVWLWLRIDDQPRILRVLILGLAFAGSLWVKLLSPFLTMGSIALFLLLQGKFPKLVDAIASTAIGFAVFYVTIQMNVTGQYVFGYTGGYMSRLNILDPVNVRFIMTVFPQAAGVVALWFSIPMMLLAVTAALASLKRWIGRRSDYADFFLLYGALSIVGYSMVILPAWGYPRYQAPFIPMLTVGVAIFVTPFLSSLTRTAWIVLAALTIAAMLYSALFVGDPMLRLYLLTYETATEQVGARMSEGLIAFGKLILPVIVALAIGFLAAPYLHVRRADLLIAVLCAVTVASYLPTSVIQVDARYSTRYRYGLNFDDMLIAAQRIHDAVPADGFVAAIDDLLYYTGRPGKGIYGLSTRDSLMGEKDTSLIDLLHIQRIDAFAWTIKDAFRGSALLTSSGVQQILDSCYSREQYGVFMVYLRKPVTICPSLTGQ